MDASFCEPSWHLPATAGIRVYGLIAPKVKFDSLFVLLVLPVGLWDVCERRAQVTLLLNLMQNLLTQTFLRWQHFYFH